MGDVHVWTLKVAEAGSPALSDFGALLTDQERVRERGYRFRSDREHYRLTRALQRWALSEYAPVEPGSWRFAAGPGGRPHVTAPCRFPYSFNLSNTRGMIVLAVSRDEVGVDVENVTWRDAPLEVAEHVFAPYELASLRALPEELKPRRFFELWTLKEAYLKARGVGLGIPLDRFGFRVGDEWSFEVHPLLGDDATNWSFRSLNLGNGYQGAVAVHTPERLGVRIELITAVLSPDAIIGVPTPTAC